MKIMIAISVLLSTTSNAQIKNAKTESVKIYGNCGMCETKIEKAGNIKKIANVDWNQETQMAILTYDATKTNQDEILKRIALVGYDSDKFLAPDDVYNNLHGCCQYDRVAKVPVKEVATVIARNEDHSNHSNHSETTTTVIQSENQLKAVFDNYFLVKDALITSNGISTASASKELVTAINNVKMDKLDMDIHMVWMKVVNTIQKDAENIANTKDVKIQRDHFTSLSKEIYTVIKISKYENPVYYQFCPMFNDGKGANWLSKENAVKNPYYGSMMLSCGKTVETIK
ncbi:copper chaperone CopZ [Flavobacterium dankookense]|uniref:Copper chaperone CopZ n=2 Tax=Flavobacterium dankookense TaxID=706186 RepID=A0A4R6QGL4_9FLAO|nr:copper chaperone CopZ [Flavobacterium dankookense]